MESASKTVNLGRQFLAQIIGQKGLRCPLEDVQLPSKTAVAVGPAPPGASAPDVAQLLGGGSSLDKLGDGSTSMQLRAMQELVQQQYMQVVEKQAQEAQELFMKQQESAQLALIMEAAEAQAALGKATLAEEQEEHHWHRRLGKRQICEHWKRGHCQRGDSCGFGHPPEQKGVQGSTRSAQELIAHNYKTKPCNYFSAGHCAKGVDCIFAHGHSELRAPGMKLTADERIKVENWAKMQEDMKAKQQGQAETDSSAVAAAAALKAAQQELQQQNELALLEVLQQNASTQTDAAAAFLAALQAAPATVAPPSVLGLAPGLQGPPPAVGRVIPPPALVQEDAASLLKRLKTSP